MQLRTAKYRPSWGAAQHRGSIRASHPAAPGSILNVPMNFFQRMIISDELVMMLLGLIDGSS